MTEDRWKDVLEKVKNFEVESHEKIKSSDYEGCFSEEIIFMSPIGKMKLFFEKSPRINQGQPGRHFEGDENAGFYCRLSAYKWDDFGENWEQSELGF